MAEVAHNVEQEFWRPPVVSQPSAALSAAGSTMVEACDRCETEFMVGARFCHVCGATRPSQSSRARARGWTHHLDFQNIKERLGLSTPSLIAFVIGVGCILAAIAIGLLFTAQTVLDWQAVQVWRIQWLLASSAAFIAGILLKKST
jgi:hypothetical protein